jgi:hypothetical protein
MTALVAVETVALLLLGLLVAGLLRSHAEILRRLHELGVGYGEERGPVHGTSYPRAPRRATGTATDIVGVTPSGSAVSLGMGRAGEQTLLLFLSSGCTQCGTFWDALGRDRTGPRTVVVARDADEESPARLRELAPSGVDVVLSSDAWDAYAVPGSPYAVVIGANGDIAGEGTAGSWEQLRSLVRQADADATAGREGRADAELRAAGILPGDPSLRPPVAT